MWGDAPLPCAVDFALGLVGCPSSTRETRVLEAAHNKHVGCPQAVLSYNTGRRRVEAGEPSMSIDTSSMQLAFALHAPHRHLERL